MLECASSWGFGRVVDCTGLENRQTERFPGFESLSPRQVIRLNPHCSMLCGFFVSGVPIFMFTKLGLIDPLLNTLAALGYQTPTPVQVQAIPGVLEVIYCP